MSIEEKLVTVAENQQKVFDAGMMNMTEFVMQNSEKAGGYVMTFAGFGWCDETYNPSRPIKHKGSYNQMFNYSRITDTKVDIDVTLSSVNRGNLFNYAQLLKTIRKIITTENNNYNGWFVQCVALENITFEGVIGKNISLQDSPLLSKASIENIVGCLSANVTGQTLTLSQTAVDNAFTTDEWNALIADKTNWTISLV